MSFNFDQTSGQFMFLDLPVICPNPQEGQGPLRYVWVWDPGCAASNSEGRRRDFAHPIEVSRDVTIDLFRCQIEWLLQDRLQTKPQCCLTCRNVKLRNGTSFADYPTITNGSNIEINMGCRPFDLTIVTPQGTITIEKFIPCGNTLSKLQDCVEILHRIPAREQVWTTDGQSFMPEEDICRLQYSGFIGGHTTFNVQHNLPVQPDA
jgi:hypothetical protein